MAIAGAATTAAHSVAILTVHVLLHTELYRHADSSRTVPTLV
jgi:hypothetical protein